MTKKLQGDALVLRNWKRFGRLMMREVKRVEKVVREQDDHIELLEGDLHKASMLLDRLLKENDMLRDMYREAARKEIEMTKEREGLPVQGYQPQPTLGPQDQKALDIVNEHKIMEEHILQRIDDLRAMDEYDQRNLSVAFTKVQEAFMWLNRAVFMPGRILLGGNPVENKQEEKGWPDA